MRCAGTPSEESERNVDAIRVAKFERHEGGIVLSSSLAVKMEAVKMETGVWLLNLMFRNIPYSDSDGTILFSEHRREGTPWQTPMHQKLKPKWYVEERRCLPIVYRRGGVRA